MLTLHGIEHRLRLCQNAHMRFLLSGEAYAEMLSPETSEKLSERLQELTGRKHVTLTDSGTRGLELLARAHALQGNFQGRKLIAFIPRLSHPSTLNAFRTAGFDCRVYDNYSENPIHVDRPETFEDYTVFVAIGLFGQKPRMAENLSKYDVIVTDGCQHWLNDREKYDMVISFDRTKPVSGLVGGGAVVSNNHAVGTNVQGLSCPNNVMRDSTRGRMHPIDAIYILDQLTRLDELKFNRLKVAFQLKERLGDVIVNKDLEFNVMQKIVVNRDIPKSPVPNKRLYINCLEGDQVLVQIPSHEYLTKKDLDLIEETYGS